MPIDYHIDHDRRLVLARGHGRLVDQDVFGYQHEVWSRPDVRWYDELVDMIGVEHIEVPSTDRLKQLVDLASGMDLPGAPTKFAIVAQDEVATDLARFFRIYRELHPRSTKTVGVFESRRAALDWLGVSTIPD